MNCKSEITGSSLNETGMMCLLIDRDLEVSGRQYWNDHSCGLGLYNCGMWVHEFVSIN